LSAANAYERPSKEERKAEMKGKSFEERKTIILKRIAERKSKMNQRLSQAESCVKAATTKEELRSCKPKKGKRYTK
jgi:hypothetical protein